MNIDNRDEVNEIDGPIRSDESVIDPTLLEVFIKQYRHEMHKQRMWAAKIRKRKAKRRRK